MRKSGWILLAGAWLVAGAACPGAGWAEEGDMPPPPPEEREDGGMEAEKLLGILKERDPEAHRLFQKAREKHPKMFHRRAREMRPLLHNPETRAVMLRNVAIELRVRELMEKLQGAKDPKQKEEAKKELRAALGEQFDARMAAHEQRVQFMQKDLERIKGKIAKRKGMRDKLIDKRVAEIANDEEAWDW